MPLVFSAITPHPPLLIPEIGQENLKLIDKTVKALKELEEDLYHATPDTIIIISPHSELLSEAFTINHSPKLKANFEKFGDLATRLEFENNLGLSYKIRERVETTLPVILTTDEDLDHGASVPLFYLTQNLKKLKIIPIGYSMLDRTKHFEFGQEIRKIINNSNERIAVIASGDLSHRLTQDAPAGFSERASEFDDLFIKLLKEKKIEEIVNLDEELLEEAGECGYRSVLILLGVLNELNYQTKILSYEGPFGVGYLVANFLV